jgi:four helix bundle protein
MTDVNAEGCARARHVPCASAALAGESRPHEADGNPAKETPCSMHSRCPFSSWERLVPFETRIRQRSASLAKQLADASESIALNLGEGRLRHAGDKRRHFEMAAGSASEVTVALRIAVAKRYVTTAELAELEAVLERVRAMLYRFTR